MTRDMVCYGCDVFMSTDEITPICRSCTMMLTVEEYEAMLVAIKRRDTREAKAIYRKAVAVAKKRAKGKLPG